MNKFLFLFLPIFVCNSAYCTQDFVGGKYGAEYYDNISFDEKNVVVHQGAVLYPDSEIIVNHAPVYLYNYGIINGKIDTNGNNLFLYNYGNINDGITTENGGNVVLIIKQNSEYDVEYNANFDVVGGNYYLRIENYENMSFKDIKNINADSVEIKNSSIIIDDFNGWQNWDKDITFVGPVTLQINNYDFTNETVLINHVSSSDAVTINVNLDDNLHKVKLNRTKQGVFLSVVNETNYEKVFDDDKGNLIEDIKNLEPDDKFIEKLNNASLEEQQQIMDSSYRFNNSLLMRPISMMNKFLSLNNLSSREDYGNSVKPFYVKSDSVNAFGGTLFVGHNFDDWFFNAGATIYKFKYSDDFNDFDGMYYGLNVRTRKYINDFWFGGLLNAGMILFNADHIYNKGNTINNPKGYTGVGSLDIGYDFTVYQDFIMSPILSLAYQYQKVLNYKDSDITLRAGADIKYSVVVDGIKYEYGFAPMIDTGGDIYAGIKLGFVSVADNAGVSFDVGALKSDTEYGYNFSLSAKAMF